MTEDALLNTPITALVIFGAATAIAMAINANMIAYSTTVTPFVLLFFCMTFSLFKNRRWPKPHAPAQRTYSQEESNDWVVIEWGRETMNGPKVLPGQVIGGLRTREEVDLTLALLA
jgi:hypothetical protein